MANTKIASIYPKERSSSSNFEFQVDYNTLNKEEHGVSFVYEGSTYFIPYHNILEIKISTVTS